MPQVTPSGAAGHLLLHRNGRPAGVLAEQVDRPASFWRRTMGLLVRPPLDRGEALWLDPCGGIHTWGMRYPIDVLFLSRDGEVLRVVQEAPPWRMVFAPRGTRSVIELRAGAGQAVRTGDRVVSEG